MIDLDLIFASGRVRRWHTNVDLSHTDDFNDAHQGRVARIILALHPFPSYALVIAALTHDDGERGPGDLSSDTKRKNPELRAIVKAEERKTHSETWQGSVVKRTKILTEKETEWLKFADKLDAFMWARHKCVKVLNQSDWIDNANYLMEFAEQNGIAEQLRKIVRGYR